LKVHCLRHEIYLLWQQWCNSIDIVWNSDDRSSYDILAMFLVLFLSIWRQIRRESEELLMIWGTYCIVLTRVVVIQFYPTSCNSIGVFECFVVRNHVNHHIKTSCAGSRMKNWRSRVLRRLLKTIQSEGNSFQVPRSFQMKERSKKERKRKK